jgi:chromosome segregation ATPase
VKTVTNDQKLDLILQKLDDHSQQFAAIDKRFEAIDRHFEAIDRHFEAIDQRFEAIDRRFEAIDQRFEAIDRRFAAIDRRFEANEQRMENMEKKLDHHGEMIKALMDGQMKLAASLEGFIKETEKNFQDIHATLKKMEATDDLLAHKVWTTEKELYCLKKLVHVE